MFVRNTMLSSNMQWDADSMKQGKKEENGMELISATLIYVIN
jgi:hypothetical protein